MLSLENNEKILPPRILIYGTEGIGKTSFGALADNPIFLPTEKGLSGHQHVQRFPISRSFADVLGYITELASKDHDRRTLVVDSLDWLEPLIWDQVCKETNETAIEKVGGGFGKGYTYALDLWRQYLEALDYLNEEKNMTIIQIAHAQIKRYENPETAAYDRYSIKLQDGKSTSASGLLLEYSDMVLFANYHVSIIKDEKVFNKERKRAIGSDERILFTQERPAYKAKNRYGLPSEIPFDKNGEYWNVIAQHVPFFKAQFINEETTNG